MWAEAEVGLKGGGERMIRTIYVLAKHNDAFDAQVNEALLKKSRRKETNL